MNQVHNPESQAHNPESILTQVSRRPVVQRTLRDSGYILATFPFALVSFIVMVTGISLAAGLAIIWVGLPIGVATLYAGHGFANMERLRLRAQGTIIEALPARTPRGSLWKKMTGVLTDKGLWREALHGILSLPVSVITWSVTLTWWAMVLAGVTGWIWEPLNGVNNGSTALMRLLHWPISGWVFDLIVGVFALVTLPFITRACAAVQAALARGLLSPTRRSLEQRVSELSQARDTLSRVETTSLRRMERDLHDGPQQTLIRLGMDLAASQRRLSEGDVQETASLLEGARQMTDSVIADIRALSRSIAPPVLAERGLVAALHAIAGTSGIPTSVDSTLTQEPPEPIGAAAYFVACEAMANAAKYSAATKVSIYVGQDDNDDLLLEIVDNGRGGAQLIPGHGLAGLHDRVVALDGRLTISGVSGTRISVVLPM